MNGFVAPDKKKDKESSHARDWVEKEIEPINNSARNEIDERCEPKS